MGAISDLKAALTKDSIPFVEEDAMLTVKAKTNDGFDVSMVEEANETIVFYEGWHEHFSSAEEALRCFMFGLSKNCRIRVTQRGGKHINGCWKRLKMRSGFPTEQLDCSFFDSGVLQLPGIFKMTMAPNSPLELVNL